MGDLCDGDSKKTSSNRLVWECAKSISLVIATGCVGYKVATADYSFINNFDSVLSLILALFSIALAAAFFFKATETSNKFYNNIYDFLHDTTKSLASMESGFGEKLLNIDKTQTSMQNKLYGSTEDEIQETAAEIEEKKESIENIKQTQNKVIEDLINESQKTQKEKEEIKELFTQNEEKLKNATREIRILKSILDNQKADSLMTEIIDDKHDSSIMKLRVANYFRVRFLKRNHDKVCKLSWKELLPDAKDFIHNSISPFKRDLRSLNLTIEDRLTPEGQSFFYQVYRKYKNTNQPYLSTPE